MTYRVEPLPPARLEVLALLQDATRFAGRFTVHGLTEADVTEARRRLETIPDGKPSITSYVVASLARTVNAHPEVNARRVGRRLMFFDDIDIVVTIERHSRSGPAPGACRVRNGHEKTLREIDAELAAAKTGPIGREDPGPGLLPTMRIPRLIRRPTMRALARVPSAAARFGPAIGISSLGMFGTGWGIPLSPMTLMVTVGGITRQPAMERGSLVEREFLPLTLSFDHSVVDGAPAARFASTFGATLEACAVLDGDEQPRKSRSPTRAKRRAGAVPQM
jgi:pyruvate/2-oxoglutarate dehydrogenase complex dihydrolipoamide acyltransferase (E2) component